MKKQDIALIIGIIGAAALFSFIVFTFVFGSQTNAKITSR